MPLGLFQIDTAGAVVYTNDRLHRLIDTDRADIEVQLRLPRSREHRYCAINLRPLSDETGPGIGSAGKAMELAERLSATLSTDLRLGDKAIPPKASIGVAWSTGGQPDAEALLALADRAMYVSKAEGAGRPSLAPAVPASS